MTDIGIEATALDETGALVLFWLAWEPCRIFTAVKVSGTDVHRLQALLSRSAAGVLRMTGEVGALACPIHAVRTDDEVTVWLVSDDDLVPSVTATVSATTLAATLARAQVAS